MRALINGLTDEEVANALQTLKTNFLEAAKTDEAALQRATLEGLVRRLAPGAAVIGNVPQQPQGEPTPFLAEILDSHIAYLRLGSLTKDSLAQFDAALTGFEEKPINAVILDLRGMPAGGDFETAANFARRFCAKGKLLFSIRKPSAKQERMFTSNQDPVFRGVLVVLTDSRTSGASEALAATLRQNADAMIIGSDTTGEAVEFADFPLGSNATLRVAIAQVILPDVGSLFPDGVKPDVAISLPYEVQARIFRESKKDGVSQFVYETGPHRFNEASLVANLNPDIDFARNSRDDRELPESLCDTVLQRAVDLITAITFFQKRK